MTKIINNLRRHPLAFYTIGVLVSAFLFSIIVPNGSASAATCDVMQTGTYGPNGNWALPFTENNQDVRDAITSNLLKEYIEKLTGEGWRKVINGSTITKLSDYSDSGRTSCKDNNGNFMWLDTSGEKSNVLKFVYQSEDSNTETGEYQNWSREVTHEGITKTVHGYFRKRTINKKSKKYTFWVKVACAQPIKDEESGGSTETTVSDPVCTDCAVSKPYNGSPDSTPGGASTSIKNQALTSPNKDWQAGPNPIYVRENDPIQFKHDANKAAWKRFGDKGPAINCNVNITSNFGFLPRNSSGATTFPETSSGTGCTGNNNFRNASQYISPATPPRFNEGTTTVSKTYTQSLSVSPSLWRRTANPNESVCTSWNGDVSGRDRDSLSFNWSCAARANLVNYNTYSGPATSSATAKVPYNYIATPTVSTPDGTEGSTYADVSFGIAIGDRANSLTSTTPYNTESHQTRWKLIKYRLPYDDTQDSKLPTEAFESNNEDMCALYSAPAGCVYRQSGDKGEGQYKVYTSGNGLRERIDEELMPNDPTGTKYCYALGVWPASSYSGHGANQGSAAANEAAMNRDSSNPTWRYSKPSCITIAKRSRVEILGAGLKVPGDITTSQSKKKSDVTGQERLYGSWSEYEAIAGGFISNAKPLAGSNSSSGQKGTFATGAGTGNYGLDWNAVGNTANYWNRQTLANKLPSGEFGQYTKHNLVNAAAQRFAATQSCGTWPSGSTYTVNRSTTCVWKANRTGNSNSPVVLSSNIIYQKGMYNSNSLGELPQALILVDGDLEIDPSVTQIDAWVIVTGKINTCKGYTVGGGNGTSVYHNHQT